MISNIFGSPRTTIAAVLTAVFVLLANFGIEVPENVKLAINEIAFAIVTVFLLFAKDPKSA